MVPLTRLQRDSSLGSKTTQPVLARMDSSRNMKSRRTLTYFQFPSLEQVRAPQTRMPWPGMARIRLTPLGLSLLCSASLSWTARPVQPLTISLAGALWTPRSISTRA